MLDTSMNLHIFDLPFKLTDVLLQHLLICVILEFLPSQQALALGFQLFHRLLHDLRVHHFLLVVAPDGGGRRESLPIRGKGAHVLVELALRSQLLLKRLHLVLVLSCLVMVLFH